MKRILGFWPLLGWFAFASAVSLVPQAPEVPALKVLYGSGTLKVEGKVTTWRGEDRLAVVYSKPNLFRIESGNRLTVCDGTTVVDYDKSSNHYVESPASLERTEESDVSAWRGFFDANPLSEATDAHAGQDLTVAGKPAKSLALKVPIEVSVELYTGGDSVVGGKTSDGRMITEVEASKVELGNGRLDASKFKFSVPTGAVKDPDSVPYTAVDAIFKESCMPCHDATNHRAGLDLTNYAGLKASDHGVVYTPGKPRWSLLMMDIAHYNRPFMPPQGSLAPDKVRTIERWIKQGAKGPTE